MQIQIKCWFLSGSTLVVNVFINGFPVIKGQKLLLFHSLSISEQVVKF